MMYNGPVRPVHPEVLREFARLLDKGRKDHEKALNGAKLQQTTVLPDRVKDAPEKP